MAEPTIAPRKTILCVSWLENLAYTRKELLSTTGHLVDSVIGTPNAIQHCSNSTADLLVMGQSVPREEKLKIVEAFRRYSEAPILSMLNPTQQKLREVEYGVDSLKPEELLFVVRSILNRSR